MFLILFKHKIFDGREEFEGKPHPVSSLSLLIENIP
jgi:hypothetical protein